ncbi:matrixin family metalloprotease, partial [Candidatus Bathyarchaeota archaeon]|nr:matrixin family metalloprotease [Desulfobacterales bacterium]NIU80970.1 matrixin family metalloprotease [Candidatus Bathyarchaeota archaeon]
WALRYWEQKEGVSFRVSEDEDADIVIVLGTELDQELLRRYLSLPDRILAVGYAISMEGEVEVKTERSVGPVTYTYSDEKVRDIARHEIGHVLGYSHESLENMGIR